MSKYIVRRPQKFWDQCEHLKGALEHGEEATEHDTLVPVNCSMLEPLQTIKNHQFLLVAYVIPSNTGIWDYVICAQLPSQHLLCKPGGEPCISSTSFTRQVCTHNVHQP